MRSAFAENLSQVRAATCGRAALTARTLHPVLAAVAFSFVVLAATSGLFGAAAQDKPFVAPAVDPTIFREGAVNRINGQSGNWSYVCDVIASMNRRFCSLSVAGTEPDNRQSARLTVSTTEAGQPGAVLYLPYGVDLSRPIEFEIQEKPSKNTRKKPQPAKRLRLLLCGNGGCQTVFPLTPADIANLRDDRPIRIRYTRLLSFILPGGLKNPSADVVISIDNAGFLGALNATMR